VPRPQPAQRSSMQRSSGYQMVSRAGAQYSSTTDVSTHEHKLHSSSRLYKLQRKFCLLSSCAVRGFTAQAQLPPAVCTAPYGCSRQRPYLLVGMPPETSWIPCLQLQSRAQYTPHALPPAQDASSRVQESRLPALVLLVMAGPLLRQSSTAAASCQVPRVLLHAALY
jgi:hypothetical protein